MSLDNVADGVGDDPAASRAFVGRDREMAELRAGFEEAAAGRGRLLLIAGEPGIGKTRLLDEFSNHAAARGARVLWGACQSMGEPAYWPWLQIIRQRVRSCELAQLVEELGPGVADIAPLIDEVRERLPNAPVRAATLEPEQARFRLFDSIATFLKSVARAQPAVLVLDDLHWADEASMQLLQFLSRELRDARLLVVGTYRHDEIGRQHPLSRALGDLTIGGRILLAGFSEPEVGRFIRAVLETDCPESVAAAVHRHTEGNPFFVSEVVRLLASDGRLPRASDIESGALGIPQGVREVIGRRLDRLSEDCSRALTVAAVIGREFDIELLGGASELTRARLPDLLHEAVAARVLAERPFVLGGFRFAHDLIRAALYSELATDQRRQLHRRVGETLEALCAGDPEPHLAELAHHFFEGTRVGDATKVIDYATRAGQQALGMFAYEEAVKHFERARVCLEATADETPLCELLLALGRAQISAGGWREGKETLRQAAQLARKTGDRTRLAQAALGIVTPFPGFGRVDRTRIALLEEALQSLSTADSALRSQVMSRLANECRGADSDETREALSREALEMARRVGDSAALAQALVSRFWVLFASLAPKTLLYLASEVIDLGTALGDKDLTVMGYNCRITVLQTMGDLARADRDVARRAQLADELREPGHQFTTLCLQATRAVMLGRFPQAEELASQAMAALLGQRSSIGGVLGLLVFHLRYEQGRCDEVEASVVAIAEHDTAIPAARAALASLYVELDREAEARSEFERLAANDFRDLPRDATWLTAVACLAIVCTFLRDTRRSAFLYQLLAPHADLQVGALYFCYVGSVQRYLAILAMTAEHYEQAEQHFQSAFAVETRLGARPALARTQLAYADLLFRRNGPADRERAMRYVEEALQAAQSLGMNSLARKAAALRSAALAAPTLAAAPPIEAAVFRKEGDYWTLAYQGRSVRLKDAKGLRDIAALLMRPGESLHVADLVAGSAAAPAGVRRERAPSDPAIDGRARQEYRARLAELREELEDAERLADLGRADRARTELDLIAGELAAAYGLGGRRRRPGDPAERARAAVTMRIRDSLAKIKRHHPALALHLSRSVKTGTFCSYVPEAPVRWNL